MHSCEAGNSNIRIYKVAESIADTINIIIWGNKLHIFNKKISTAQTHRVTSNKNGRFVSSVPGTPHKLQQPNILRFLPYDLPFTNK